MPNSKVDCHVCFGSQEVLKNFYVQPGEARFDEKETEPCRTCQGHGKVWPNLLPAAADVHVMPEKEPEPEPVDAKMEAHYARMEAQKEAKK